MPAAAACANGCKAHGDPRDPKVDPVDWVERIPLSETRNYVQRVMENVLVYRARFEGSGMIAGKSDQRVVARMRRLWRRR